MRPAQPGAGPVGAFDTLLEELKLGACLPGSMTATLLWIRPEECASGARGSRKSTGLQRARSKCSSNKPRRRRRTRTHDGRRFATKDKERTTPTRTLVGLPRLDEAMQAETCQTIAESDDCLKRNPVPLPTAAQHAHETSESKSDRDDSKTEYHDNQSGNCHVCDSSAWYPERGDSFKLRRWDDSCGDAHGHEDKNLDCSSRLELWLHSQNYEAFSRASQEVDGDLDISCSSASSSAFSRTLSISSQGSSVSSSGGFFARSSGFGWSFSSRVSHSKRWWHASASSMTMSGRLLQQNVESSVQAEENSLRAERKPVQEKVEVDLRERVCADKQELGREQAHREVVKMEKVQIVKQVTSKYDAAILNPETKVQDQETFREKMLDKLAEHEDDESESAEQDAPQTKKDVDSSSSSSKSEALQQSNVDLITEIQKLRQKYQAQSFTLSQAREAIALAHNALETK